MRVLVDGLEAEVVNIQCRRAHDGEGCHGAGLPLGGSVAIDGLFLLPIAGRAWSRRRSTASTQPHGLPLVLELHL